MKNVIHRNYIAQFFFSFTLAHLWLLHSNFQLTFRTFNQVSRLSLAKRDAYGPVSSHRLSLNQLYRRPSQSCSLVNIKTGVEVVGNAHKNLQILSENFHQFMLEKGQCIVDWTQWILQKFRKQWWHLPVCTGCRSKLRCRLDSDNILQLSTSLSVVVASSIDQDLRQRLDARPVPVSLTANRSNREQNVKWADSPYTFH